MLNILFSIVQEYERPDDLNTYKINQIILLLEIDLVRIKQDFLFITDA